MQRVFVAPLWRPDKRALQFHIGAFSTKGTTIYSGVSAAIAGAAIPYPMCQVLRRLGVMNERGRFTAWMSD